MNLRLFPHLVRFHSRLCVAMIVGALAAWFLSLPLPLSGVSRTLVGWTAGVWAYLAMMGFMMVTARPERIQSLAEQEDESAVVVLSVISLSAIASLVAIVHVLATAKHGAPHQTSAHVIFAAATLLAGWLLVPTVYTLHYARLYFSDMEAPRALMFPDVNCTPDYWDFLYFSFTIAVASQTADIGLASKRMRRAALAQAVLSFFFNLAVLGLSINIASGLLN